MRHYDFRQGRSPLVLSVPHAGTILPPEIAATMTESSLQLPDTDWFVPRLYALPELSQATRLIANVSRYVVDLNRPPGDESLYPGQQTTGICPETHFDGTPVYRGGTALTPDERSRRIEGHWRPYHQQLRASLDQSIATFGYAILLDAHSIASRVPRLFDGQLPDLNFGTFHGRSATAAFQSAIEQFAAGVEGFSAVVNGRFVGGYITRHYGGPQQRVEAVQLEISQAAYMDETARTWDPSKAERLQAVLARFVALLGNWRPEGAEGAP